MSWRHAGILLVIGGVWGGFGGGLGSASAPARAVTDPLVVRLQARLDRLESLRGRFVQSVDSKSLGRPHAEEGRFCMKKPSRMRWDYEKPEEKLAILDGRNSWLYIPADREVYRGTMKALEESGAAALLMAGRLRLDADFDSRRLSVDESGPLGAVGAVAIELKPRKPSGEFDRLVLAIVPDGLQIRRLGVIDALGGRMIFDFFDLEEDLPLPDDLFHFEVPPGVEVIESR